MIKIRAKNLIQIQFCGIHFNSQYEHMDLDKKLDFHKAHKEWKSRLQFYQDEIKFFFKELNMVFDQNKKNLAWMEFIDEYEAILDKKSDKIQQLLLRIDASEKECLDKEIEQSQANNHHQLHLDVLDFEEKYNEMKRRFKRFASHND